VKTAELLPPLLDYWVAKAEDEFQAWIKDGACWIEIDDGHVGLFAPSTVPSQGRRVIERANVTVAPHPSMDAWLASAPSFRSSQPVNATGPNIGIAAMRAKVASVYGEEVPDEVTP
jgi:hypothetical protein